MLISIECLQTQKLRNSMTFSVAGLIRYILFSQLVCNKNNFLFRGSTFDSVIKSWLLELCMFFYLISLRFSANENSKLGDSF